MPSPVDDSDSVDDAKRAGAEEPTRQKPNHLAARPIAYPELTDNDLCRLIEACDTEAFAELHRRYSPRLLMYLRTRFGSGSAFEDIAQDVWLEVYRRIRRNDSRPIDNLLPFMFSVAHNMATSHLRRRRAVTFSEIENDAEESPSAISPATSPDEVIVASEMASKLTELLSHLPLGMQETIQLRLQGLTFEEVSAALGLPIGTVASRYHRALQMLREGLHKAGFN